MPSQKSFPKTVNGYNNGFPNSLGLTVFYRFYHKASNGFGNLLIWLLAAFEKFFVIGLEVSKCVKAKEVGKLGSVFRKLKRNNLINSM